MSDARPRLPAWIGSVLAVLVSLTGIGAATGPAVGQEVAFTPRADRPAERRLGEFLERERFRILAEDTVLAPGDTLTDDVLLLNATLRSSGHLGGDVFAVGGDLFLRPGGTVAGDVVALSGGYYASGQARVEGTVTYRPNVLLRVVPRDGGWEIFHVQEQPSAVELHGLSGFHLPTYRRVDGWTLGWGGTVRAIRLPAQPEVDGAVRFHTEGSQQLEGSLRAALHPTGRIRVGLLAERRTRTRDRWIRGDLPNTVSYLVGLGDFRNYYRAERVALEVASTADEGLVPSLSIQWEEASSLDARPLAVLFDDDSDVRTNPAVDEGRVTSLSGELAYRHGDSDGDFTGRLGVEAADSTVAGDFSFLLAEARINFRRRVVADHRIELVGVGRWDVAGDPPRQRWSALGGTGSLPALERLGLRGPRMAFASATWLVPLEALRFPVLGAPRIFLRNALGTAWSEGETFRLEDNVMAGIRFLFLEAGLAVDVTESDLDGELVLGVGFPGRF